MSVKYKTTLFRDLLFFQEIIRHGKISEAAEKNGIKSSNLSRIVKNLELRLGKQLFYRNNRGMVPTAAALKLSENIKNCEHLFDQLSDRISDNAKQTCLKLYHPENISFSNLSDFEQSFNTTIQKTSNKADADVIVDYAEPQNSQDMICVELNIGKNVTHYVWICSINKSVALELLRFIVCQMHA